MLKKIAPHLRRGMQGERIAERFLRAQGLSIVAKNVRSRYGEIDLIAKDNQTLVFIEVRLRQRNAQVSAAESITPQKQRKWHKTAQVYLQQHYPQPPDCRFDAVCISAHATDNSHHIDWLQGVM